MDQFLQPQQISSLDFSVNMLKEIETVFLKCQNLRALVLSINHITEIRNLDQCINLIELNLSKNQIAVICNLEGLKNLKVLDLSLNRIMRIQNLENQIQLERLLLYGNQIEYLEGLDNMTNLKELLIHRNKLRSLNYLAIPSLQSLVKINASYNLLPQNELDNISHVTLHLYNLRQLDLYGNQVFNSPAYKFRLTENSSLEKLDGLDVQGVIKVRLDNLRKDWQVNKLIEETSEEAKKWIEAEREIKGMALNILAKKQDRITSEFDNYKKQVDDDVLNFITYISDLKQQRNQGVSDKITFESLNNWRYNISYQENQRIEMLEDQLGSLEEKRKETVEEAITSTNFLDKLHEISMQVPDVWSNLKKQEYQNSKLDQNRSTPIQSSQKPQNFQSNQKNLDNLMKSGMKIMGNRMRQDLGDEIEQAKFDFDDQARLEKAAEQRSMHNSQYLNQDPSKQGMQSRQNNLKATTPQKYENDIGNPNINIRGQGKSFIDQFKSDPKQASQGYNMNQSIKGKQQPIPIEFQDPNHEIPNNAGGAIIQKSSQSGIRTSQETPPQNKNTKACIIF